MISISALEQLIYDLTFSDCWSNVMVDPKTLIMNRWMDGGIPASLFRLVHRAHSSQERHLASWAVHCVCVSMADIQRATFQNSIVLEDYSSLYHHEAFWNSSLQCFGDASANHIFPLQAFSCTQCMAFCTVPCNTMCVQASTHSCSTATSLNICLYMRRQ